MATSYPVSLPASPTNFKAARFGLHSRTNVMMSPLSGAQQVVEQFQMWAAEFVVPPLDNTEAPVWKGFLVSLRGRRGTFRAGDPAYTARGLLAGTPLVNGGSQTGRALITDGWTASTTGKVGDYFQLGDYLYQLTEDFTASGGGAATLAFEPSLRSAPADNAPLTVTAPKGLWRLASDEEGMWDEEIGPFFGFSFKCHEAL